MGDASAAAEIEAAISAALARRGVSGTVVVREGMAELHGAGPVIAIELGEWVEQWLLLPPELRDNRADGAAERLRAAMRQVAPVETTGQPASGSRVGRIALGLLVLAALASGGYWFWRSGSPPADGDVPRAAEPAPEKPRAAEVCEAGRRRLNAGAVTTGIDTAGWVVELWLARPGGEPIAAETPLVALRNGGAKEKLAPAAEGSVALVRSAEGEPEGATLRFEGGYVPLFFEADGRSKFVALADELADAVGAHHAALFARCGHLTVRDVGAYFRGRDPAEAAVSLLYAQGVFLDPPAVDTRAHAQPLAALRASLAAFDVARLEQAAKPSGARVSVRRHEPARPGALGETRSVGLIFALGGPTRAQSAARDLAARFPLVR